MSCPSSGLVTREGLVLRVCPQLRLPWQRLGCTCRVAGVLGCWANGEVKDETLTVLDAADSPQTLLTGLPLLPIDRQGVNAVLLHVLFQFDGPWPCLLSSCKNLARCSLGKPAFTALRRCRASRVLAKGAQQMVPIPCACIRYCWARRGPKPCAWGPGWIKFSQSRPDVWAA